MLVGSRNLNRCQESIMVALRHALTDTYAWFWIGQVVDWWRKTQWAQWNTLLYYNARGPIYKVILLWIDRIHVTFIMWCEQASTLISRQFPAPRHSFILTNTRPKRYWHQISVGAISMPALRETSQVFFWLISASLTANCRTSAIEYTNSLLFLGVSWYLSHFHFLMYSHLVSITPLEAFLIRGTFLQPTVDLDKTDCIMIQNVFHQL